MGQKTCIAQDSTQSHMFGGVESRCQRQCLGKIQHSLLELMYRMSVELDPSLIAACTLPYEYTDSFEISFENSCCQRVYFVLFAAISKHFIHMKAVSFCWHAALIVALPMVHKQFPLSHAQFLWFHTKGCMGVIVGCIKLGIIVQLQDCIHYCVMNPFYIYYFGAYSSKSNRQWYTLSEVRPRATLVRFLWSVKTLISCPYNIPLNSFNVSTMARSSISVTLYFCCILDSFLLKNAIGLLS